MNIREYINRHFERFLDELVTLCRIPSISTENRGLVECAEHCLRHLEALGFEAEVLPLGGSANPPLVYGRLPSPGARRTLLLYGHFDVQPVDPLSEWTTAPFEPTIRAGCIYGRGTSDDKGQFFAVLKGIQALRALEIPIPVHIICVLDSQEEIGSPMLAEFVCQHRELFRADYGIYPDNEAFEGDRITMNFGNRGTCHVIVRIRTAARDVHSGTLGGPMPNAAWRIVEFLKTLRDDHGKVLIDGFYEHVAPPTEQDRECLRAFPYDAEAFRLKMGVAREIGLPGYSHWEKIAFLPTCEISGITAGYQGRGVKTVIPSEAIARIDMRLVKNQQPDEILEKFTAHAIKFGFEDLEIEKGMMYHPSRSPLNHPARLVIEQAIREVFGREPLINPVTGGANPSYVWNEIAGIPMMEISFAQHDARAHAPNECLALDWYRKSIETAARMLSTM